MEREMKGGLPSVSNKPDKQFFVFAASVIFLLLIFGSYLRIHDNNHKLFWFDEIYSALWYSGHDLRESFSDLKGREIGVVELQNVQRLDENSNLRSVIESIIRQDPQHTPLYYLVLNLWAKVAGDSIGSLRSLSALVDLLILPLLFWLCLELSGSTRAAWVAVVLVAISPFHIVYSQEARQYTLLMLTVILSGSCLLWTLRAPAIWKWCLFALTLAAGLYTHLLFCFVILSHAVYVFASEIFRRSTENTTSLRNLFGYSTATVGGIALFAPWIWVLAVHFQTAVSHLSWSRIDVGFLHLVGMWAYNYSAVFLDTNHIMKFLDETDLLTYGVFFLRALSLIPAALAVLYLFRHPFQKISLFLLPLIFLPFLGLALPDVIIGGMRSGGGNRYLAPSFIGLEIAMAYWFSLGLVGTRDRQSRMKQGMLALILVMGISSGLIFRNSDTWWHKTIGHFNMTVAEIINREERPLLIARSATSLLSLSHHLDEKVVILFSREDQWDDILERFSDVFILSPSEAQLEQFAISEGLMIEEVFKREELFKISRQ
jgi:uncharacterized membrane protein